MSIEIDEIDLDIEDEELDVDLDDVSLMPKKKGRPQSDHYVKESDLRDEIGISQANKEREISKLEALWNKKIDDATTDMEKEAMQEERANQLEVANTKTYCTSRLGEIVVLTVDRVATQTKFRHYTYLDDMKAEAIYQSIKGITKFDLNEQYNEYVDPRIIEIMREKVNIYNQLLSIIDRIKHCETENKN